MRTALTLGKYAPLHRGHELVIRTALAEADHVIVMIYDCPETTAIPLRVRARWIEELFPSVEVMLALGGPTEVGDAPAITGAHDAYIRARLEGRRITHFYSSEFYGAHVSQALGAVDRRVDPDRRATFLCGDDIPYDDTWDRSGSANRALLQRWTFEELTKRSIPFALLTGSLQVRLAAVTRHLRAIRWLCANPKDVPVTRSAGRQ